MDFLNFSKLWSKAWLIAIALILGALAALALALVQPTLYLARARLLVGPGISNSQPDLNVLRASGQLILTYAELPTTEPFLQSVIDELKLGILPADLADLISVRPSPETQILTIEVQYPNAVQAQAIAALIAEKLIQISPSNPDSSAAQLKSQVSSHVQELEQSIGETRQTIQTLQVDYQKALGEELMGAEIAVKNQVNANQLSDYERNADLIANADTQSAAGLTILSQLVDNTNIRITQFEQHLTPDLNSITRKLLSDQIQAERVHLSNLQQAIVELNRPIEGQPLNVYIQNTLKQQRDLEQSLSDSLSFDFRRLQFDRITLMQDQLKYARTIESDRQKLILARIANERDRLYQIEQLNLSNQQGLLNQLTLEQDRLSNLQNTLSVLYTNVETADPNNVELIELAKPIEQKAPLSLMVIVGGLAAATLAAAAVLAINYINNKIETPEHITSIVPLPVLEIGKTPSLPARLLRGKQSYAEHTLKYQMIGMRLLYSTNNSNRKMVLVSPVDTHDNASVVAAQLAIFLARAGKRVILIDCNPDKHTIASLFQLGERPGLSDYLGVPGIHTIPLIQVHNMPNLGLLPYGNNTQFDTTFLATPQMLTRIEHLTDRADVVVLSAPALQRPDALMMASYAMGVVMVLTRGRTPQKTLQELVSSLNMVGANLLAAVLKPNELPFDKRDLNDHGRIQLSDPVISGPDAADLRPEELGESVDARLANISGGK